MAEAEPQAIVRINAAFLRGRGLARPYLTALDYAVTALALLTVLACCVQWHPLEAATGFYEYRLHDAVALHSQFGRDVVATYGPLGFVGLSVLHPDTFVWAMLVNVAFYVLTFWQLTRFFNLRLRPHRVWPSLCAAAVLVTQALLPTDAWSPFLYLIYVWVILETHAAPGATGAYKWMSPVVWAMFSLVKVSSWPLSLVLALVCTVNASSWRLRAQWWSTYAACLALVWLVTGQRFANVPAFISTSLELARGYRYAMSFPEPAHYGVQVSFTALGGLAVCVAARDARHRERDWRWLLPPFGWALCSAHLYQTAFVRPDGAHVVPNLVALVALAPLAAACVTRRAPLCLGALAVVGWGTWQVVLASNLGEPAFRRPLQQAEAGLELLTEGMQPMLEVRASSLRALARRFPLQGIESIDVPTGDAGVAEANGIRLMQAPGLYAYGHYTPILARLHQRLLERPDGPQAVMMCGPAGIDRRMPTEADAWSFASLWTHFEPAGMLDRCAVFKRAAPTTRRQERLPPRVLRMHEKVMLPNHDGGALWVSASFNSTWKGKLVNLALKPWPLYLKVWLESGARRVYQINPLMTADGFMLSPLLDSSKAMLRFYANGEGNRITALRFFDHGEGGYESDVHVELSISRLERRP